MDVFKLREAVVGEYRDYVESFVRVLDSRIDGYVKEQLAAGELWPDSVLQLNPAYEPTDTLGELTTQGVLTPETARFFGPNIRLHRHQRDALSAAQRSAAQRAVRRLHRHWLRQKPDIPCAHLRRHREGGATASLSAGDHRLSNERPD